MDPSDSSVIAFITDELTTDPWMSLAFEGAREKALELGVIVTLGIFRAGEDPNEDVFSLCQRQPLLGYIFGTILTRKIDPPAALSRYHRFWSTVTTRTGVCRQFCQVTLPVAARQPKG
jgi:LacI family transcriptional regulator